MGQEYGLTKKEAKTRRKEFAEQGFEAHYAKDGEASYKVWWYPKKA